MPIQKAVHWHITWLEELLGDFQTPSKLDPKQVARADVCKLGEWIYEIHDRYHTLPEYKRVMKLHLELHEAAADAVTLAQAGKLHEARQYLSVDGRCVEASKDLLISCNQLIKIMDEQDLIMPS